MTKSEFDALGITERDLVCVTYNEWRVVGSLNFNEDYSYILPNPSALWEPDINLATAYIQSIEILRKDFWQ